MEIGAAGEKVKLYPAHEESRLSVRVCAAASLALVTGCTSYKLAEPASPLNAFAAPPPDRAQICVLRDSWQAQAVAFPVHDGGVLVGATRGPGYFCYLAAPGKHRIAIESDEIEDAQIVAEAGGRYYLLNQVDNIFGYVRSRSVWLAEREARNRMEDLDPQVLVGVPGNERLPAEVPFAPAEKNAVPPARGAVSASR